MKKIFLSLLLAAAPCAAAVRHEISARLEPSGGFISAEDTVTLPAGAAEFVFSLHKGLAPSASAGRLEELQPAAAAVYGINFSSGADIYAAYRLTLPAPADRFTLRYAGVIAQPPGEQAQEYARSFSETPGLISSSGCYLSGASGWYPLFEGQLATFRLSTDLPAPYDTVAGGSRVSRKFRAGRNLSVWETRAPQDEITLTCGRYSEYDSGGKPVAYQAFLLSPDKALADRYLDATGGYIDLYSGLIGPYPYGKFALVENFWETGYGLPSFTLLGSKVLRLPFIINSSYPHEILHNWWGNGVFVDYGKGNWCEGLTAYLADYLIAENRGKGGEYRMTTLQKYSDYVRGGADFPLTAFRSRHSSASEAVGYGKSLMFYHMLRGLLGDENFRSGLRSFYAANKFRTSGFSDLRAAFEKTTGAGRLAGFFSQWTERTGAPELALKQAKVTRGSGGYDLEFTVAQVQEGPAYELQIPAAIYLEGFGEPRMKLLPMKEKEETYHYNVPLRPSRLEIDPQFDLFRKLSPLETPPTLSRLLGAAAPALVLPAGPAGEPWRPLAAAWQKDPANLPSVVGDKADAPPAGASYWLMGGENRLAPAFEAGLEAYGAAFTTAAVTIDNRVFPRAGRTFVFAAFHPDDPAFSGALILSDNKDKLGLLAAKLPHYGKYSWLVFDENMNSAASGIWTARRSPLAARLSPAGDAPARGYPTRAPLAELPSPFSAAAIQKNVKALTSLPGGRAPGTPGHEQAAALIAGAFKAAGLEPFQGDGFRVPDAGPGLDNIVGMAKGTGESGKYLVLSAHYDRLPAVNGAPFPGADDNASGAALLLELARWYGAHPAPRTIIFAAFDGEEGGRAGSRAFLAGLPPGFRENVDADLNFDTIGRLNGRRILVLGSASSDKWVHIIRGAGFVTGSDYDLVREDLDSSDQASFIEAGIPGIQFFSGPHADYHKTSDTADKIDARGIAKQGEFAKEIIDYLAGDSEFITRPAGSAPARQPGGTRKASTGLVPAFAFSGPGVRAQEVTPGSPLSKTAFRAGDVITALDGTPVEGLKDYSEALKKLSPGQKVTITFLSGGKENTAALELGSR